MLGLIFGSFIAAIVVRWPQGRSVMTGRSACDNCGHRLGAVELIPLVSVMIQRGACRHCGAPISPLHLTIELTSALVGALALGMAPGLAGLGGALLGWTLVALIALDALHYWLPDRLTLPLALAGLGVGALGLDPPLYDRLAGAVIGYISLTAIAVTYKQLRGRDGLGGGDPKLLAAIGAWLGWQALPYVLIGGSGIGLLFVLVKRLRGGSISATDRLPLGALMALAAFPLWIWQQYYGF